jgi:hypothetical protein
MFLKDPVFGTPTAGHITWEAERFAREHADDLALFDLVTQAKA